MQWLLDKSMHHAVFDYGTSRLSKNNSDDDVKEFVYADTNTDLQIHTKFSYLIFSDPFNLGDDWFYQDNTLSTVKCNSNNIQECGKYKQWNQQSYLEFAVRWLTALENQKSLGNEKWAEKGDRFYKASWEVYIWCNLEEMSWRAWQEKNVTLTALFGETEDEFLG